MTDADRETLEYLSTAMDRLADAIRELVAELQRERAANMPRLKPSR